MLPHFQFVSVLSRSRLTPIVALFVVEYFAHIQFRVQKSWKSRKTHPWLFSETTFALTQCSRIPIMVRIVVSETEFAQPAPTNTNRLTTLAYLISTIAILYSILGITASKCILCITSWQNLLVTGQNPHKLYLGCLTVELESINIIRSPVNLSRQCLGESAMAY